MLLVILLPIICAFLVSLFNKEIILFDDNCPPHNWSKILGTDILVCTECGKKTSIDLFV